MNCTANRSHKNKETFFFFLWCKFAEFVKDREHKLIVGAEEIKSMTKSYFAFLASQSIKLK
jgi:hypothetical protein